VQDALEIVVVAVVVVAAIVGIATLLSGRSAYDHIGRGALTFEHESRDLAGSANAHAELEAEVRSFVVARNERRVALCRPPLDVEAEVERRLSGPDG
jgi:hypothetical protein